MVGGLRPPPKEEEEQHAASTSQGVIFVLESANLEIAKVGKAYQLLNSDDHNNFLLRHNKDPALYRPDVCHQALLMILDSPLNKAGKIKAIYVHTNKNVLIQVSPHVRIPRTFKRFAGLMVQLLQKLSIRATNGPDKLLKVIKGPVTRVLPVGAIRVGMSHKAPDVISLDDLVALHGTTASAEQAAPSSSTPSGPIVFVVGAFAHGQIDYSYTDKLVSISQYPLSAAYCLSRITNTFERAWGVC